MPDTVIKLDGLKKFRDNIQLELRNGSIGPFRAMFKKWAMRYSAFVRRRFVTLSRSGGSEEWPDLAESTKKRRARKEAARVQVERKDVGKLGKSKIVKVNRSERVFAILRDTGVLFNAMNIGAQGNLLEDIPDGVRYGFKPDKHPGDPKDPKKRYPSIQEIAVFHDEGGKNGKPPPQRRILVEPDDPTMDGFYIDFKTAVDQELGNAEIK